MSAQEGLAEDLEVCSGDCNPRFVDEHHQPASIAGQGEAEGAAKGREGRSKGSKGGCKSRKGACIDITDQPYQNVLMTRKSCFTY